MKVTRVLPLHKIDKQASEGGRGDEEEEVSKCQLCCIGQNLPRGSLGICKFSTIQNLMGWRKNRVKDGLSHNNDKIFNGLFLNL